VFDVLLQLVAVSDVAAQGTSRIADLESALARAKKAAGESGTLRDKIKVRLSAWYHAKSAHSCIADSCIADSCIAETCDD
jgi:hypothetical protein